MSDLQYWLPAELPVILICSHPMANEAWLVHVQGYFADPARRADRRVDFTKAAMAFEDDISDRLFAVADPRGQAPTPVAEHRAETLVSNLLPVGRGHGRVRWMTASLDTPVSSESAANAFWVAVTDTQPPGDKGVFPMQQPDAVGEICLSTVQ